MIAAAVGGGEVAVLYADGTTSDATIVGSDPLTDLAVVRAGDDAEGTTRDRRSASSSDLGSASPWSPSAPRSA